MSRSSNGTSASDDPVERLRAEIDALTGRNRMLAAERTDQSATIQGLSAMLHHLTHHCTTSPASQRAFRLGFEQGYNSGYPSGLRHGSLQGFSSGYDHAYNQYLNIVQPIVCTCCRPPQTQPVPQAATGSEGHSAPTDSSGAYDGFQALLTASQIAGLQQTQPGEGS